MSFDNGEWRASEPRAPTNAACEKITHDQFEDESASLTARCLAELAANPEFQQWQAHQQASTSTPRASGSGRFGKKIFSRLGDTVASISPSKWRPTRIRVSQVAGKHATPDRNCPPTPTTPVSSSTNPHSRVFTSPRQRVIRIASPIQGAVDQDVVSQLLQGGGSSPNSKRRLAFDTAGLV